MTRSAVFTATEARRFGIIRSLRAADAEAVLADTMGMGMGTERAMGDQRKEEEGEVAHRTSVSFLLPCLLRVMEALPAAALKSGGVTAFPCSR